MRFVRYSSILLAGVALAGAAPALAQTAPATPPGAAVVTEEPTAPPAPITITGSAALVSDYRFRGVSQSDEDLAVQGSVTATHESGAYVGFWASNLAGWGTFGGANLELDILAGFKFKPIESATVDVGITYYLFPGGADKTDFFEPYVKLSGTRGPLNLTAGVAALHTGIKL